jgi:O-antigen/teichoic acid export membrane protein
VLTLLRSGIYLLARYGSAAAAAAGIAIYTRSLSLGEYGVYSLILGAGQFAYATLLQWLRIALVRYLPGSRQPAAMLQTAGAVVAVLVVVSALVAGALAWALPVWRINILCGWLLWCSFSISDIVLGVLQAQMRSTQFTMSMLGRAVASLGFGVWAAWSGWGPTGIILGTSLGYVVGTALGLVGATGVVRVGRIDSVLVREFLWFGGATAAVAAFVAGINVADRYIIALMLGPAAAGSYAAPVDAISRTLVTVLGAVNLAGAPVVFKAFEEGGLARAAPHLERQLVTLLALALPLAVAIAALGDDGLRLFLGPAFRDASRAIVPWAVTAAVVQSLQVFYLSYAFSLAKRPQAQVPALLATAAVNLAFNVLFISLYGVVGAAIGTALGFVVCCLLTWWLGRRLIALPLPGEDVLRVVAATLVFAGVFFGARLVDERAGIAGLALAGAAYLGALLAMFWPQRTRFLAGT